jgi:hypothetical protein
VFDRYQLLLRPTLACLPVDNAADGYTKGPDHINGEAVDPLIGWCLTYPSQVHGTPGRLDSGGNNLGTTSQSVRRSLVGATLTPTFSRPAQHSSVCGRGGTHTEFAQTDRFSKPIALGASKGFRQKHSCRRRVHSRFALASLPMRPQPELSDDAQWCAGHGGHHLACSGRRTQEYLLYDDHLAPVLANEHRSDDDQTLDDHLRVLVYPKQIEPIIEYRYD